MNTNIDTKRWNQDQFAVSRTKRAGSSAPSKKDLAIYKRFTKQAIEGNNSPRVLILGATPELRDLALSFGCETIAVDISWKMLVSLHDVMEYKDDPQNWAICYNWLKIDNLLAHDSFDIILADNSICNLPPDKHERAFQATANLLKKNGVFITQNGVFLDNLMTTTLQDFQKAYDEDKINWLIFYWCLVYVWRSKVRVAPHQYSFGKVIELLEPAIKNRTIIFHKEDEWKIANAISYGKPVIHTVLPEKEFLAYSESYFDFLDKNCSSKDKFATNPIYLLRKK